MFDDDIITHLKEQTKEIDADSLTELLTIVPHVADVYNGALYNALMRGAVNDDNIDDLITAWGRSKKRLRRGFKHIRRGHLRYIKHLQC